MKKTQKKNQNQAVWQVVIIMWLNVEINNTLCSPDIKSQN